MLPKGLARSLLQGLVPAVLGLNSTSGPEDHYLTKWRRRQDEKRKGAKAAIMRAPQQCAMLLSHAYSFRFSGHISHFILELAVLETGWGSSDFSPQVVLRSTKKKSPLSLNSTTLP